MLKLYSFLACFSFTFRRQIEFRQKFDQEPAQDAKKAAPETTGALPASAVPVPSVSAADHPPLRPDLPDEDHPGNAVPVVTAIIDWAAPQVMAAAKQKGLCGKGSENKLEQIPPLEWLGSEGAGPQGFAQFKEVWNLQHAEKGIMTEGLYEAGGSLWWLSIFPEYGIVPWSSVVKGAGLLLPKVLANGKSRITWPFQLEAAVKKNRFVSTEYPSSLQLVHGHVIVYSWWLTMYRALRDTNQALIDMLLECALTVTIQVRVMETPAERFAAAILVASQTFDLSEVMSEHFVSFAGKLSVVIESLTKDQRASQAKMLSALSQQFKDQLRFQGKPLNKTMLSAAVAVHNGFPDQSKGQKIVDLLHHWHGNVVGSYAKWYKLVNTVSGFLKDMPDNGTLQQERGDF